MRAAAHDGDGYGRASREIIQIVQPNRLFGQLQHGADTFLRIKASVSGATMNLEGKHSSSLPRRLSAAAARRRFKHQNGARILTFGFDQTASAWAASLFITRQQDGDRRPRA